MGLSEKRKNLFFLKVQVWKGFLMGTSMKKKPLRTHIYGSYLRWFYLRLRGS